ncbi:MAG TPA: CRISPR-associated protein Cas4 [Thermoplasmata archaeon]|nr:CRISPR-associated protein Cas4 [Thermoplasmata archaeon]
MALAVFSASDVEKYGYCPLTWWLSRDGAPEEGEEIQQGQVRHAEVGHEVASIDVHERKARESETTVLYYAIASTVVALLGVSFVQAAGIQIGMIFNVLALIWMLAAVYFLYKAETLAIPGDKMIAERVTLVFAMVATVLAGLAVSLSFIIDPLLARSAEVAALLWLIGASYFLSRTLRSMEIARQTKEKYAVEKVSYVDTAEARPKLFESARYGLRGRPDYVSVQGEHHIPVEVKTGRTPKGPLFSHILQVGAYCVLLEEEYGKPPTHGVIRYPAASFDIEYNEDLKHLVLAKMEEMRRAVLRSENPPVHRNHNRPGKCQGCSRRSVCPERLA